MPKKWVCVEAELAGTRELFVGKLEYPFQKELEHPRGFALFECLLVRKDGVWRAYPDGVAGSHGQTALRRDRIIAFSPLRESSAHWEGVWREALAP